MKGNFNCLVPSLVQSAVPYTVQQLIGMPLYYNFTETTAESPLFGSLYNSHVKYRKINAYLSGFTAGGFEERSTTTFCRNGILSERKAYGIGVYTSLFSALSASIGWYSGTEKTEMKTSEINGLRTTEESGKAFFGLLSLRIHRANRGGVKDILPPMNMNEIKHIRVTKADGSALAVEPNLPFAHLAAPKMAQVISGPAHHEKFVLSQMDALSFEKNGRTERTLEHYTQQNNLSKLFSIMKRQRNLHYHDKEATEINHNRLDVQNGDEHITRLTTDVVKSDVRDLIKEEQQDTIMGRIVSENSREFGSRERRLYDNITMKTHNIVEIKSKLDETPYDTRLKNDRINNCNIYHEEQDFYKLRKSDERIDYKDKENDYISDATYMIGFYTTTIVSDPTERKEGKSLFREKIIKQNKGTYQDKLSETNNSQTRDFKQREKPQELYAIQTSHCRETNQDGTPLLSDINLPVQTIADITGETTCDLYAKDSTIVRKTNCKDPSTTIYSHIDGLGTFLTRGTLNVRENPNGQFGTIHAKVTRRCQKTVGGSFICLLAEKPIDATEQINYEVGQKNFKPTPTEYANIEEIQYSAHSSSNPLRKGETNYKNGQTIELDIYTITDRKQEITFELKTEGDGKIEPISNHERKEVGIQRVIKDPIKDVQTHGMLRLPVSKTTLQVEYSKVIETSTIVSGEGATAKVMDRKRDPKPPNLRKIREVERKTGLLIENIEETVTTHDLTSKQNMIAKRHVISSERTLSSGAASALSSLASGITRIIVNVAIGKEVTRNDLANVVYSTAYNFITGHAINKAVTLNQITGPLIVVAITSGGMTAVRKLMKKDENSSTRDQLIDAASGFVITAGPSALNLILAASKHASKADHIIRRVPTLIGVVQNVKRCCSGTINKQQAAENIAIDLTTTLGWWAASSVAATVAKRAVATTGKGVVDSALSTIATAVTTTLVGMGIQYCVSQCYLWWRRRSDYQKLCPELKLDTMRFRCI
jgi:hypothetical protein